MSGHFLKKKKKKKKPKGAQGPAFFLIRITANLLFFPKKLSS